MKKTPMETEAPIWIAGYTKGHLERRQVPCLFRAPPLAVAHVDTEDDGTELYTVTHEPTGKRVTPSVFTVLANAIGCCTKLAAAFPPDWFTEGDHTGKRDAVRRIAAPYLSMEADGSARGFKNRRPYA